MPFKQNNMKHQNQDKITERLSTVTSCVYMQSFAAYKMKSKRLVNYMVNDLDYIYIIRPAAYLSQERN